LDECKAFGAGVECNFFYEGDDEDNGSCLLLATCPAVEETVATKITLLTTPRTGPTVLSGGESGEASRTVEYFAIDDFRWVRGVDLPAALYGNCQAPLGRSRIFVAGGINADDNDYTVEAFILDLQSEQVVEG